MEEGIQASVTEEEIAEYLINEGYPAGIQPISCILSGSRAYGLNTEDSDRDYLGIHLMDTWDILEHPDFRPRQQVIRKSFTSDLEEVPVGTKGGDFSLDSFEMWKFISLLLKGSFVTYEILYLPEIHHAIGSSGMISLMREGLTNKIGRAAKGNALHDWRKSKKDKKKAVMAYYRLLQAIYYLREEEFEWRAEALWDYLKPVFSLPTADAILESYLKPAERRSQLEEIQVDKMSLEIEQLIDEVNRAMVITKLPDQCPKKVLQKILETLKRTRGSLT